MECSRRLYYIWSAPDVYTQYIIIIIIITIIFIETRLQDTIGKIIKYRWLG